MFGLGKSSGAELSGADKMMILGSMLSDLGAGQGPRNIIGTQSLLAGRAKEGQRQELLASLQGLLGGGYDVGPAPVVSAPERDAAPSIDQVAGLPQGPAASASAPYAYTPPTRREPVPLTDPRWGQAALAATTAGINISPLLEIAKANKPEYVRGRKVNPYDPNAPDFIPDLEKGMTMTPDGRAAFLPDFVQNQATLAGAVESAKSGAQAGWDLVEVPMANGQTTMLPRAIAAPLLAQRFGASGGGQGGAPQGLGVRQSPAEQAYATDSAKGQAEREIAQPKVMAGLRDQSRATDLAINTINDLLGQTIGPDGEIVQTGDSLITGMNSGFLANMRGVAGTPAYALDQRLAPLKGIIGFGELAKMRENSPTGGALGNVTERENQILQSLYGALDTGQPKEQLAQQLMDIRNQLITIRQQREQAFNDVYGQGGGRSQSAAPSRGPATSGKDFRILKVE